MALVFCRRVIAATFKIVQTFTEEQDRAIVARKAIALAAKLLPALRHLLQFWQPFHRGTPELGLVLPRRGWWRQWYVQEFLAISS